MIDARSVMSPSNRDTLDPIPNRDSRDGTPDCVLRQDQAGNLPSATDKLLGEMGPYESRYSSNECPLHSPSPEHPAKLDRLRLLRAHDALPSNWRTFSSFAAQSPAIDSHKQLVIALCSVLDFVF